MRSSFLSPIVLLTSLLSIISSASAIRLIESKSLNTCQDNSSFTASLFDVVFTPNNLTLTFDVVGVSSIQGNVTFGIEVSAYGYVFIKQTLDPCTSNLNGLCPMSTGQIDISSNLVLDQSVVDQIPAIAYGVPDLDANVKILINSTTDPGASLACVEASLSNGQTVDQKGVGWATAVISGMALVASAVTSGLGHSNTAAHVAANALSLFGYFQSQAIVGMTAVPLPPIVQSWTQNFDWTMGIIEVNFMQSIATWYQKATGGTPATILNTLTTTSVTVEKRSVPKFAKRSVDTTIKLLTRAHEQMTKRSDSTSTTTSGIYIVKGIHRVAFRADIESTNLFLTGLAFFCIFIVFTILFVAMFKGFCEMAIKSKWMKSDKFQDFRNGWFTVLKGIMFRMVLIGYPQMTVLCLWEFTQVDSPAEVVLAIFFFFGMTGTLAWAAAKVIRIAKRSVAMHKNAAYILYSDPSALNKWGFLYVQFRATAYYFILPVLVYTVIKGMFVAFGQGSGTLQAVALVIVEAIALIGASVIRPWMDKSTNTFNISICAVNFLNAIFLLIFTDVFNQPGLVTGVVGVIFFIANAAFSLVLLILVLLATIYAFVRKNPDTRYQPVADDRASFIKSQTQLTTELDALGATARGDMKGGYKHNLDLDDDNDSWSSDSMHHPANMQLPPSTANSGNLNSGLHSLRDAPHSPIDPAVPLFPAGGRGPPPNYQDNPQMFQTGGAPFQQVSRPNSAFNRSAAGSPGPGAYGPNASTSNVSGYRMANDSSPGGHRNQNNASPWQRGAGYDHA
ncbi:putative flavin carrier protein 2-1 [Coleophoma cylindrospora]|uniref:Putative flavin carrier protein 2-1 n=1 Tax=Coleophoma cylindrospora TaxID=1849047 RepID=A0A3D8S744_9HELO|nr:putative flavin carrier protein 2-1 [Coleophoma cylindrospora]